MKLTDDSNLSDLFLARIAETPDAPAYRQYTGENWVDMTWGEVGREVGRWQAALRKENLRPGDRVAVCLRNRTEWVLFDQAAIGLGLVTVPLYFDDRPENMAFCINDAGARVLFLENGAIWPAMREQAKTIERVVCLNAIPPDDTRALALQHWLPPEGAAPARSPARADDLVTLVYTSGTTGRPKGVMLSHKNILSNVLAAMKAIPSRASDRFVSFLPLSHMFERTCGYYTAICCGGQTVYARGISVLADDIREQQPTVLIAVPRIFERIWGRMQEQMPAGSPKRRLFDKSVEVGWRRFQGKAGAMDRLLWPVLRALVAKKLYHRLGGRIRLIIVGGAAFSPDLARVFIGLGLPIIQGYGLTETAPILCANREHDNDPASIGRPLEGIEMRLDESGEILARGPNLMLGYWNKPEATAAVIDKDGWFHTGDLGRVRDGRFYITGRLKDVIVLSNGEKVSPTDVEQAILMDPAFEQVMLVGEGRPKLGLIAVSSVESEAELCERANRQLHGFPGYTRIHHVARIVGPWSIENGLLTPTMKVKRGEIERRFRAEIEAMYRRDLRTAGGT
ncbi:AMP-dependent synthetase/ligase [Sulfurifustis variabilis]|nr:AMP-dependent synthetase/ligase [Sulfurifustis variabilis]